MIVNLNPKAKKPYEVNEPMEKAAFREEENQTPLHKEIVAELDYGGYTVWSLQPIQVKRGIRPSKNVPIQVKWGQSYYLYYMTVAAYEKFKVSKVISRKLTDD